MARNSKKAAKAGRTQKAKLRATVKADDATVILGRASKVLGATIKTAGLPGYGRIGVRKRLGSGFSNVAQRIVPKRVQPLPMNGAFALDKKANRKIKKIARQLARQQPQIKRRRSRLPIILGVLLGLIGFGAYYTYQVVPWTKIGETAGEYLSIQDWLAKTSGKKKPEKRNIVTNSSSNNTVTKRVVTRRVVKRRVVKSPRTINNKSVVATQSKRSWKGKSHATIAQQKKLAEQRKKQWKKSVATLEKGKRSKYRQAKYRKSNSRRR